MSRFRLCLSASILLGLVAAGSANAAGINDKAPVFTLSSSAGSPVALKGGDGHVTLVNFWASWCGPCAIEFPNLNKLASEYKAKGLQIDAINIDRDRPSADKFLNRFAKEGLSLNVLFDPKARVAAAYGARALPSSYIVDSKGVIRFTHVGFRPDDPATWRREIDSLLTNAR